MEKAKEVKSFAEKLITVAKKGTLAARRQAIAMLGNRDIIDYEDGQRVRKGTVIGKLFSELGPRYLDRPGGYTRIIRLSLRRLGDNGQLVLLQLVGADESPKKQAKKRSRKKAKEPVEVKGAAEGQRTATPVKAKELLEIGQASDTEEMARVKTDRGEGQK
jgi:large subunit ribosomal protein L17